MDEKIFNAMKKELRDLEKKRNAIYKQADPINKRISNLRDKIAIEGKKKLVGKCFVFRNGDSISKWNLYSKVVGYNNEGVFMLECQKKPNGEIEIDKILQWGFGEHLQEKEISEELFDKKFNEMIGELKK